VITREDIKDVLTMEQAKRLMGCEDNTRCIAEATRAVQSDLALACTVGKVGGSVVMSLTLIDLKKASPIGRASETMGSLSQIGNAIPRLLAQLFGGGAAEPRIQFRLKKGQKLSVAVMDLKPTGISKDTAQNLTQVLSVEIKKIEGTKVVARDDLVAMLLLEKDKRLLGCDDTSCMAEIGGALGVDKLIAGTVGKLADSFVTTLRLIDVRNIKVESRVTEAYKGAEDQLIRAVRHAGRRLFGIQPGQGGKLAISASQEGATVIIDGDEIGSLPMPPSEVDNVGRHVIQVVKDGYLGWQSEVYVDPGETTAVWTALEEKPQKWYQKWWVWTIVGGVVLGGTTAMIYFLQPAQSPGHGDVIIP
jgi:hypothetical protein